MGTSRGFVHVTPRKHPTKYNFAKHLNWHGYQNYNIRLIEARTEICRKLKMKWYRKQFYSYDIYDVDNVILNDACVELNGEN